MLMGAVRSSQQNPWRVMKQILKRFDTRKPLIFTGEKELVMISFWSFHGLWRVVVFIIGMSVLTGQAQEGVSPRFIPCGAGAVAVCDLQTGLMWERKIDIGPEATCDNPATLHDAHLLCTPGDGLAVWLSAVNAEGGTGYAGYSDWRVPHIQELVTLFDYERGELNAVDPLFGPIVTLAAPIRGSHLSSTDIVDGAGGV